MNKERLAELAQALVDEAVRQNEAPPVANGAYRVEDVILRSEQRVGGAQRWTVCGLKSVPNGEGRTPETAFADAISLLQTGRRKRPHTVRKPNRRPSRGERR